MNVYCRELEVIIVLPSARNESSKLNLIEKISPDLEQNCLLRLSFFLDEGAHTTLQKHQ